MNNKIKKRIIISSICIFLTLILGISCILIYPKVRIAIAEKKYLSSNEPRDLIYLSMLLVHTREYNKIYLYLPKVMDIENLQDEINKSAGSVITESLTSKDIYNALLAENMFSYIYVGKYEEYLAKFPQLYKKLIESEEPSFWNQKIKQIEKLKKEDYETIIKSLKDNCPDKPELVLENNTLIKHFLRNLLMQVLTYQNMGDEIMSKQIEQNMNLIADQYMQKLKEINNKT